MPHAKAQRGEAEAQPRISDSLRWEHPPFDPRLRREGSRGNERFISSRFRIESPWNAPDVPQKGPDRPVSAILVGTSENPQYSSRNINVVTDRSHSVIT
jgi:hypothetical protein